MLISPTSEVRLLSNVPLTSDNQHQMTFNSLAEQTAFFQGKTSYTFTELNYQKEIGVTHLPKGYDELYNCNYLMYRNTSVSSKWYYAFITKKTYVNPNSTIIEYTLDVFQTWQFDTWLKPSFVEREHTTRWNSDGSPVVNTVDEGLNYGSEYINKRITRYIPYDDVFFLIIVCKNRMDTNGNKEITPVLNGSPQPLTYYIHPFKMDGSTPTCYWDGTNYGALSSLTDVLKNLYKITDAQNNIVSLYVTEYPGFQLNYGGDTLMFTSDKTEPVTIQDSTSINTFYLKSLPEYEERSFDLGNKYDGYDTVTESKLLMYPYTVTILSDLKGNQVELKNEYMDGQNVTLKTIGGLGTSNKVAYYIDNYLGLVGPAALQHAIINSNPNDVPIITDLLSAYIQGNRNTIKNQSNSLLFNSVFGAIGNSLTRNIGGAIQEGGNSYFQVQGMLAKMKDLDNTPPSISNLGGNTAFDYGNDIKGVYVIKKQITAEYQKKLTDFFKMYGYKVNEVKVPNLKSRQHYNYIKTVGAVVFGDAPREDMEKIQDIFNAGVTLWHGDWVCDYSKSNGEV